MARDTARGYGIGHRPGRRPASRRAGTPAPCARGRVPSVVVMTDVFLHVGLYKTGTTTIQGALAATAEQLAAAGVLFPGAPPCPATRGLRPARPTGGRRGARRAAGALGRLVDVTAHDGPTVVVSEEELSLARPRQARRLVRALAGHRVHVVIGARDMARTLVSAWQQTMVNGGTTTWADFVGVGPGPGGRAPSEGMSFRWRHDLLRVVDTWSAAVPAERIRLVTVPPPGRRARPCWPAFAAAADLPAGWPGAHPASATSRWARPSWRSVRGSTRRWAGRQRQPAPVRDRGGHPVAARRARPPGRWSSAEHREWTQGVRRAAGGRARTARPRPSTARSPTSCRPMSRPPAPPSTGSRTPSCSPPRVPRSSRSPSTTGSCSAATGARSSSGRVDCRDPPRW